MMFRSLHSEVLSRLSSYAGAGEWRKLKAIQRTVDLDFDFDAMYNNRLQGREECKRRAKYSDTV